jgi:hypothetical protein
MTQDTDSAEADSVELELGSLLFQTAGKSDNAAALFLLLLGFFCLMFGLGFLAHPQQMGGSVLGPLLIAAFAMSCGAAFYFWKRKLYWRCFEHGVIESTRWTTRTLLYSEVQTIEFSVSRTPEGSGDYEQTTRMLILEGNVRNSRIVISSETRTILGLVTDPIPNTEMETIRDRVASLVAQRMELAMNSSGSVRWTRRFRLLTEGIEIAGRFGLTDFVPWNRISNVAADHAAIYFWNEGVARPFAKMRADESNAYAGLRIVLSKIAPLLEQSNKEAVVEIPEGSLQCPNCGKPTDSLKRYEFLILIFLGTHSSGRKERFAACPSCMRRYLYAWGLSSVLTANVLWPFLILPKLASRLLATVIRGHSIERPAFRRILARDFAQLGLIGSIVCATTAGLFFAFGETDIHKWSGIAISGSLASFLVCAVAGAFADV